MRYSLVLLVSLSVALFLASVLLLWLILDYAGEGRADLMSSSSSLFTGRCPTLSSSGSFSSRLHELFEVDLFTIVRIRLHIDKLVILIIVVVIIIV